MRRCHNPKKAEADLIERVRVLTEHREGVVEGGWYRLRGGGGVGKLLLLEPDEVLLEITGELEVRPRADVLQRLDPSDELIMGGQMGSCDHAYTVAR